MCISDHSRRIFSSDQRTKPPHQAIFIYSSTTTSLWHPATMTLAYKRLLLLPRLPSPLQRGLWPPPSPPITPAIRTLEKASCLLRKPENDSILLLNGLQMIIHHSFRYLLLLQKAHSKRRNHLKKAKQKTPPKYLIRDRVFLNHRNPLQASPQA